MSTVVSEDVSLTTLQSTLPVSSNTPPQPACDVPETSSSEPYISNSSRIEILSFSIVDAINYGSVILLAIIGLAYNAKSYWAAEKSDRLAEESNRLTEESNALAKMESCRLHPTDKALYNTVLCTEMRQKLDYDQIPTRKRFMRWFKRTFGQSSFKGWGRRLQDGLSSLV